MLEMNQAVGQEFDTGAFRWNGAAANHCLFEGRMADDADVYDAVFYQQALPALLSQAEGQLLGGNWLEAARLSSQLLAVDGGNQRARAIRDTAVAMARGARDTQYYDGVLALYAKHLLQTGDARHALQYALRALEQHTDEVLAGTVRAAALAVLGEREKALRSLEELCRIAPDNAYTRYERARLYLSLNRFEAALEDANELLRRHGTSVEALEIQAQANMALGRTRQVFFDATSILELQPDHAFARRWLWVAR